MSLLDTTGLVAALDGALSRLRRTPTVHDTLDSWWQEFRLQRRDFALPIDQAIAAGVLADRVGYAFAGGYQAALVRLDPTLAPERVASLSVTEDGGGHPQAIATTLTADGDGWRLDGRKKWATMSAAGAVALVAAKVGVDDQGRNRLRLARVDLGAPGVGIEPMPETEFVPEVRHCRLRFDGVRVREDDLLPGDGYVEYVKPFRTLEDIFVSTAVLTYLLGIALRHDWPRDAGERLLGLLVSLRGLGLADPRSPVVHVALEGVLQLRQRLVEDIVPHWDLVEPAERARWVRDQPLTSIAGRVRGLRTEAAWKKLG